MVEGVPTEVHSDMEQQKQKSGKFFMEYLKSITCL